MNISFLKTEKFINNERFLKYIHILRYFIDFKKFNGEVVNVVPHCLRQEEQKGLSV